MCKGHDKWRMFRLLKRFMGLMSARPAARHSRLGRWVHKQRQLMRSDMLSQQQRWLLSSLPNWNLTRSEFNRQCRLEERTRAVMASEDIDVAETIQIVEDY